MSVDIQFIAEFMTEDIDIFNDNILLEDAVPDITRREFLKKVMGYTTAAAIQNPVALLQKIATGQATGAAMVAVRKTLANMSNDELSETPEELWLPYISTGRLAQFRSEHPEHFDREVLSKFYTLCEYVNSGRATISGTAERMMGLMKARAGVNPTAILNGAFSNTGKWADGSNPFLYNDSTDMSHVIKTAKKLGINLDTDIVKSFYEDLAKENAKMAEQNAEGKAQREEMRSADKNQWAATVQGGIDPDDENGALGYKDRYFEFRNQSKKVII